MNNDNDSNLHLHDQMSGWLRYWFTRVKRQWAIAQIVKI